MYENSARLLRELHHAKRIKSEAALRYTVGDPLMEMLCDSGRLKVQLEESVKSNKDEPAVSQPTTPKNRAKVVTPSTLATKVADATSGGSRADYTCYTLRDSDDQILAVVLETKMDHSSQDAVAQVMGYVAAFKKGDLIPPAALVVTETLVDILLFPFIHDDNRLLTAAQISVKLWQEEVPLVEPKCLLLVACLAFVEFKLFTIEQPTAKPYEQMRKIVAIATESEEKDEYVAKLEAQLSEKEKENEKEKVHNEKEKAQLSAELRKLEARNRKLEAQLRELRN